MTLRRVTAPLLRPGMLSAFILLFIVFFREYPVSLLLYTERSIPMAIAVYIILDNQPLGVAAAFALLQTILLLGAALLFRRIAGEQELRV
jgi:iron(III) transport system permease protein